jgi:hypothetical protein
MPTRLHRSLNACLIAIGLSSVCSAESPDWAKVTGAWDTYCRDPTEQTAATLLALLPERELPIAERPDSHTVNELYYGLTCLSKRMQVGNESAIRIGFRLLYVADAAFAEDLSAALGELSRTHPSLFLRLLRAARLAAPSEDSQYHDPIWVVDSFDSDLTLEQAQQDREERIDALSEVRDPETSQVRDEAVKLLRSVRFFGE